MTSSDHSPSLGSPEAFAAVLRDSGLEPEEVAAVLPLLPGLQDWTAPAPTPADRQRLLRSLSPLLLSPVRQAVRRPVTPPWAEGMALLGLVRSQVSVFRPAYWLSSAVVVLLGVLAVLAMGVPQTLALYASGPLLTYLGTMAAFRSAALGLLELELACPPSPRQLTLARLVLVLGYDSGLGLLGSLLLRPGSGTALWALTLHWLAPLLLIAGLTLVLSLRMPAGQAAALTYLAWLGLLLVRWLPAGAGQLAFATSTEELLAVAGLALVALAIYASPTATSRLLPHQ